MRKRRKGVAITPVGYSAESVTGSCLLIQYEDTTIAVEIGGVQEHHTPYANYRANKKLLSKIKPSELDFIFALHAHYDHIGLIPAVFHSGKCHAKIICTSGMTSILKEMWLDSLKIMQRDAAYITKQTGKQCPPLYDMSDIQTCLVNTIEYGTGKQIDLVEDISFQFFPAGHIFLSQQLKLSFHYSSRIKTVLVTSDLGNRITEQQRIFVEKFHPVEKANVVFGESTYGSRSRRQTKYLLYQDIETMKSIILHHCIDMNGRVLFPTFSLDKTPFVMWILHQAFHEIPEFNIPILIDSPLAIRLLHHYASLLPLKEKKMFHEMMHWKCFKFVEDYEDSMAAISDHRPKVILSSGGMLQSGRSVLWASDILPHAEDCIIFTGYCGSGTLGSRVLRSDTKTIKIGNKQYPKRCAVYEFHTMSGHMQHSDLIRYYSSIQADAIYLLHGNMDGRIELQHDIQKSLANSCRTTKVVCVQPNMVIKL